MIMCRNMFVLTSVDIRRHLGIALGTAFKATDESHHPEAHALPHQTHQAAQASTAEVDDETDEAVCAASNVGSLKSTA